MKDKRTYTGYTSDFQARLKKHNSGQVLATKHRRPLKLIRLEEFKTPQEAKKRELYWKGGAGRRKLKKLFSENKGISHVILACTDLQLLIPQHPRLKIFDTMKIFADATTREILRA